MKFKVTFNHGLQNPIIVEAEDVEDAKRQGLAYHRLHTGFVESVDRFQLDFVVKSAEIVD